VSDAESAVNIEEARVSYDKARDDSKGRPVHLLAV